MRIRCGKPRLRRRAARPCERTCDQSSNGPSSRCGFSMMRTPSLTTAPRRGRHQRAPATPVVRGSLTAAHEPQADIHAAFLAWERCFHHAAPELHMRPELRRRHSQEPGSGGVVIFSSNLSNHAGRGAAVTWSEMHVLTVALAERADALAFARNSDAPNDEGHAHDPTCSEASLGEGVEACALQFRHLS
jgi:hypothetical protein